MIKFTIVTITYQAERVLERTMDSVISQSYPYVEYLIVDGASTDGTLEMAKNYQKIAQMERGCHEVRIVSEPDKGLYDAMNKARMLATGDYVLYLNAGDFFPSNDTLETIVKNTGLNELLLNNKPLPAVIYGDTDLTDNDGVVIGHRRLSPPEHLDWRSFRHGMLVCHQAFYARTDIVRRVDYNMHYRHSADVDWCIRVMKEAEWLHLPLVNVHAVVANYQREGQSTRYHRASLLERFDVMRRHYGLLSTLFMHAWFVVRAIIK